MWPELLVLLFIPAFMGGTTYLLVMWIADFIEGVTETL